LWLRNHSRHSRHDVRLGVAIWVGIPIERWRLRVMIPYR